MRHLRLIVNEYYVLHEKIIDKKGSIRDFIFLEIVTNQALVEKIYNKEIIL
jgi:hypothetical protein